jgi:serine/threonine-protein kinase RsbT
MVGGVASGTVNVPIRQEDDIIVARQCARELAKTLGFRAIDQSRITTAVSELARNVVRYATDGRGEVLLRSLVAPGGRAGIEIVVRDDGPGIADINLALSEGYTSGRGLGMGLPGTRRLMDEMTIESVVGQGTTVTIRKWQR